VAKARSYPTSTYRPTVPLCRLKHAVPCCAVLCCAVHAVQVWLNYTDYKKESMIALLRSAVEVGGAGHGGLNWGSVARRRHGWAGGSTASQQANLHHLQPSLRLTPPGAALPCLALPCPALPCLALPCPALPCPPCMVALQAHQSDLVQALRGRELRMAWSAADGAIVWKDNKYKLPAFTMSASKAGVEWGVSSSKAGVGSVWGRTWNGVGRWGLAWPGLAWPGLAC